MLIRKVIKCTGMKRRLHRLKLKVGVGNTWNHCTLQFWQIHSENDAWIFHPYGFAWNARIFACNGEDWQNLISSSCTSPFSISVGSSCLLYTTAVVTGNMHHITFNNLPNQYLWIVTLVLWYYFKLLFYVSCRCSWSGNVVDEWWLQWKRSFVLI
jgi:hypothetical protein